MNSGNKKEEGLVITLHYKIYSNMKMLLRNMGQNPEIYKVVEVVLVWKQSWEMQRFHEQV